MLLLTFWTISYIIVATLAAIMTSFEQRQTHGRSPLFIVLGFVACALWPVTLVITAVSLQLHKA